MKDIRLKIKHVYWPFLLIAGGVLVGYTFLNWLLILELQLFQPKEINFVGILIEPVIGEKYTLISYIIAGILSSFISLFFNEDAVSVGASGAIMGMYGIFAALLVTKVFNKETTAFFAIYLFVFIVYNLFIGLSGDIDNAAHIGGLITGFVLGIILRFTLKHKCRKQNSEEARLGD